jgi:uncharacterized protein YbaR (Trm112 family)
MVDQELLDLLVCPETRQPVRVAEPALLERLNAAITAGGIATRGGRPITEPVTEGLVREDGLLLYPVRDDIPIMLIDEALSLEGIATEPRQ